MVDVIGLAPGVSISLVAAAEVGALVRVGVGGEQVPHARYREAGSAQKIFYEPMSITQDLWVEEAFARRGLGAPTVDEARTILEEVGREVPLYELEADGEIWRIANRSRPCFSEDPLLARERWVLLIQGEGPLIHVTMSGAEVRGALAWLPLLDGHHGVKEVEREARRTQAGAKVLEALGEVGALYAAPEEPFTLEALPELLFMSHSSVLVRSGSSSVLVDPALLSGTEVLSREGRRPFEIASHASAILVTHHHWDHLAFQTMLRIPRGTTILVPRQREAHSLANPPIAAYLRAFGFTDVVEVGDWDSRTIGELELTFVPFFGEPFGLGSRFDAFTYLIRANGRTIYGSLDACHDEAGDMDPVLRELAKREDIDVFLFGSSAQRHDPLYRAANMRHYSNELTTRPDLVRYHPSIDDVIRWCDLLKPRALVPYANFVYFGIEGASDVALDAGSNVASYWASLEGHAALARQAEWRGELSRLERAVRHELFMLHPMQGLHLR